LFTQDSPRTERAHSHEFESPIPRPYVDQVSAAGIAIIKGCSVR
jgi:hypothetical protein